MFEILKNTLHGLTELFFIYGFGPTILRGDAFVNEC